MASIAYITDRHMIEFHRLNGNQTISFWRPSVGKRFTDFNHGDLLFFLAKGTEMKTTGEKGIIGYGRFDHSISYSFRQMWNHFESLNGYPDQKSFKDAILRVAKAKTLPANISSLILKDIVFFQAPVYLSEFGMKISNNLESFIYLDKEDPEMTVKILKKANEIGVDAWANAMSRSSRSSTVFEDDLARHVLQLHLQNFGSLSTEKETRKQSRILNEVVTKSKHLQWLDARKQELIAFNEEGIELYFSIDCNKNQIMERVVYSFGKFSLIRKLAREIPNFIQKISFKLMIDHELPDNLLSLFKLDDVEIISHQHQDDSNTTESDDI